MREKSCRFMRGRPVTAVAGPVLDPVRPDRPRHLEKKGSVAEQESPPFLGAAVFQRDLLLLPAAGGGWPLVLC